MNCRKCGELITNHPEHECDPYAVVRLYVKSEEFKDIVAQIVIETLREIYRNQPLMRRDFL